MKFDPIFKETIWGEEIWRVSDLEGDESIISTGYLEGNSLGDILETYLGDLVGDEIYEHFQNHFPLLIKSLNIKGKLSVQVHPDDEIAFERYDSYGKNEAWYILDASPEAVIYMGFNREVSASEFYQKCKDGTITEVLNRYKVQPGDFFYIGAGTVHAAEGDISVAEIQQSSDITFRLYDWGRENDPTTGRETHLEEAIDIIDYDTSHDNSYYLKSNTTERTLAENEYFIIKTHKIGGKKEISPSLYDSFIIYICVDGEVALRSIDDKYRETLIKGETLFIPASCPDLEIIPIGKESRILEIYMEQLRIDS